MPPSALFRPIERPPGHDSYQASSMSALSSIPWSDAFMSVLSLVTHSRICAGQFLRSAPFDSPSARSFTASRSTRSASLRSMATVVCSCNKAPKHIHILPCNPPADAQDHKILSDNKAVDSAAHWRFRIERFYSMAFPSRLANRICPILAPSAASSHHADFLRRRKRIIFPRCSRGIHFPLCFRNFSGTWYSITLAMAVTIASPIHNECDRIA